MSADYLDREARDLREMLDREREQNDMMRKAIVRWFVRAFKEG